MNICYFGGYRENYPRSRTQITALRQAGHTIIECRVPPKLKTIHKIIELVPMFWARGRQCEVIIVAEFNQSIVPTAWLLSRLTGATIIFDPAVSYYDEMVITQTVTKPSSLRARYLFWLDRISFNLSDIVIWYMPDDCDYFEKLFTLPSGKQVWLPPALDSLTFQPLPPKPTSPTFVIHLNSSYLPTHGIDIVLQAAHLVRDDPEIIFELYGQGPTYNDNVAFAKSLGLTNLTFHDPIPITQLPEAYARADVCLGAFRDDAKLARLIELKIISALASRRPVIAADSPLKRKFFSPNEDILLVPPGNAQALAHAIRQLKADPAWRNRLAEAGLKTVQRHFSIEKVGQQLTEILNLAISQRHGIGHSPARHL